MVEEHKSKLKNYLMVSVIVLVLFGSAAYASMPSAHAA